MRVLVGVDERERAVDAVRLGAQLAAVEGGELVVAHVYPRDPTYGHDPAFAQDLRRRAQERLARLHAELPDVQFEDRHVHGHGGVLARASEHDGSRSDGPTPPVTAARPSPSPRTGPPSASAGSCG